MHIHARWDRSSCARLTTYVAVPGLLFFIDWLSRVFQSSETEFLLVPPLAVIIYLLFSDPEASYTGFRSVVLTPTIGALIGELCYRGLGLTPWSVALATLAVLFVQALLRSHMPPALALAVLAMLLKAQGSGYTVGVALASILIWLAFLLWRRVVWMPLPATAPTTT